MTKTILAFIFLFSLIILSSNNLIEAGQVIQKIRVIKSYINHVIMQCPTNNLIRSEHVKWINEKYDFNKPDESVLVTSNNLIASSQINLQLYDGLTHLSCGYILNNCYVRLKIWEIECVANPAVFLKVDYNPTLINFAYINESYGSIGVQPSAKPLDWNKQLDLLRLKCINNFDYPINTKYIWMYAQNPFRHIYETWHKYDIEPLTNHIESIFQTFYNPDQNRNCPLSDFLRNLCTDFSYQLTFQCASYFEKANSHEKVFLLADSKNFTIICADAAHPPATTQPPVTIVPTTVTPVSPEPQQHHNNNGALIGGLVGGILGLLLLLTLIALLLFCLRRRRRNRMKSESRTCQTINIEANSSSSIVYPNLASNSQIMYNNTADKASQFSNQIEISNMDTASSAYGAHNTIIHHTVVPETYVRMITIQKDCCDDNISSSNEMITNQYDTYNNCCHNCHSHNCHSCHGAVAAYQTDDEAYQHTERRDYFIHNYQHQSDYSGNFV